MLELELELEMAKAMETLAIEATRQGMRFVFVVFGFREFFRLVFIFAAVEKFAFWGKSATAMGMGTRTTTAAFNRKPNGN